MARPSSFKITIEGLEQLQGKLEPEHLYGSAVRDMLEFAKREGERQAIRRAPVHRGALRGSITGEMKASGVKPHALIKFSAAASGFPYGHALNSSKKFRRSISVPGGAKGRPTYKWFTGIIALIRKAIRQRSKVADSKVEQVWQAAR